MRKGLKYYIAWTATALLTIISVVFMPSFYLLQNVYSNSIKLICSSNYVSGFMFYARSGETLHIDLNCVDCNAVVNLTLVGGVNKTITLTCEDLVSVHVERSGLTIAYVRVESCSGGAGLWLEVRSW
jgi:hypothetical protein